MTSVHTPFDQIAASAIELLLDGAVESASRLTLPTLIPRASTARPGQPR